MASERNTNEITVKKTDLGILTSNELKHKLSLLALNRTTKNW